ncbi:BES1-interacting Myc-like protein 2 [Hibiscus syriacus]|uniref:BES1-interacting Myc-like protein 2 n=1 Tax=Hibiscus syriacus TaxID=106335 RepID=A0A6A3BZA4_HIBSY|nr:BES1-interacting Myc-like protein 2 [Hibiscus syriacus]
MVKSVATAQLHQEDEDDDGFEDREETVKVEEKGSEQKTSTNRSKHSETEQRRRKYIQFLQEKLLMYEGSYHGWSQEPTKMIPWKNHHGVAENFIDHSHTMKNGSTCENDGGIPSMVANMQNSIESNLGDAAVFKILDHPPASSTSMVNMQTRSEAIATHGRGSIAFHESAIEQEDLTIRDESVGLSSAYSQGILNSLTQALQSSGVDMSQSSISVKIDVGKRVVSGVTSMPSSSKEKEIRHISNQVIIQTGVRSCSEESGRAYKRHRTGES